NDRWRGRFQVTRLGRYEYTVTAWVDRFLTWQHDCHRREDPADIETALKSGAIILRDCAGRASGEDAARLERLAQALVGGAELAERRLLGDSAEVEEAARGYPDRSHAARHEPALPLVVEPVLARFST